MKHLRTQYDADPLPRSSSPFPRPLVDLMNFANEGRWFVISAPEYGPVIAQIVQTGRGMVVLGTNGNRIFDTAEAVDKYTVHGSVNVQAHVEFCEGDPTLFNDAIKSLQDGE